MNELEHEAKKPRRRRKASVEKDLVDGVWIAEGPFLRDI